MCFVLLHNSVHLTEYSWLKISITSYTVRSWQVSKGIAKRRWVHSVAFRQNAWDRPRLRRSLQPKSKNGRNCNCTAVADGYSSMFLPVPNGWEFMSVKCDSLLMYADIQPFKPNNTCPPMLLFRAQTPVRVQEVIKPVKSNRQRDFQRESKRSVLCRVTSWSAWAVASIPRAQVTQVTQVTQVHQTGQGLQFPMPAKLKNNDENIETKHNKTTC